MEFGLKGRHWFVADVTGKSVWWNLGNRVCITSHNRGKRRYQETASRAELEDESRAYSVHEESDERVDVLMT